MLSSMGMPIVKGGEDQSIAAMEGGGSACILCKRHLARASELYELCSFNLASYALLRPDIIFPTTENELLA